MFMQFRGMLYWQCPACLFLNNHQMRPLRYKVACTNNNCNHVWAFGGTLYSFGGGRKQQPPDLIPIDGGVWRNGKIHKVLCDSCSDVIAEHLPPPVQRWPEMRKRRTSWNEGMARSALNDKIGLDPEEEPEEQVEEEDGISGEA